MSDRVCLNRGSQTVGRVDEVDYDMIGESNNFRKLAAISSIRAPVDLVKPGIEYGGEFDYALTWLNAL